MTNLTSILPSGAPLKSRLEADGHFLVIRNAFFLNGKSYGVRILMTDNQGYAIEPGKRYLKTSIQKVCEAAKFIFDGKAVEAFHLNISPPKKCFSIQDGNQMECKDEKIKRKMMTIAAELKPALFAQAQHKRGSENQVLTVGKYQAPNLKPASATSSKSSRSSSDTSTNQSRSPSPPSPQPVGQPAASSTQPTKFATASQTNPLTADSPTQPTESVTASRADPRRPLSPVHPQSVSRSAASSKPDMSKIKEIIKKRQNRESLNSEDDEQIRLLQNEYDAQKQVIRQNKHFEEQKKEVFQDLSDKEYKQRFAECEKNYIINHLLVNNWKNIGLNHTDLNFILN